jgi:hypothetical protein
VKLVRAGALASVAAVFAAAILSCEDPVMMAVGMAPLAWLALEGVWRLFRP